ncbi:hypothetical protein AMATHDRAFT_8908 [Amanita thiersii Skay4041]|uniref:Uncharacterized protein n=1 Tax=Amanita thiersii Skay4041 TaxID=703135 RepID=A0A2A9NDA2_9AGAR|nr:hypothetical protein AMATHDRAFT_8908 [Amanita thiersii Skay4041]
MFTGYEIPDNQPSGPGPDVAPGVKYIIAKSGQTIRAMGIRVRKTIKSSRANTPTIAIVNFPSAGHLVPVLIMRLSFILLTSATLLLHASLGSAIPTQQAGDDIVSFAGRRSFSHTVRARTWPETKDSNPMKKYGQPVYPRSAGYNEPVPVRRSLRRLVPRQQKRPMGFDESVETPNFESKRKKENPLSLPLSPPPPPPPPSLENIPYYNRGKFLDRGIIQRSCWLERMAFEASRLFDVHVVEWARRRVSSNTAPR